MDPAADGERLAGIDVVVDVTRGVADCGDGSIAAQRLTYVREPDRAVAAGGVTAERDRRVERQPVHDKDGVAVDNAHGRVQRYAVEISSPAEDLVPAPTGDRAALNHRAASNVKIANQRIEGEC